MTNSETEYRLLLTFDTEKSNFTKVITQDYDPFAIYGITDFFNKSIRV